MPVLCLTVVLAAGYLWQNGGKSGQGWRQLGTKVALLSAALNMPDAGLALLREQAALSGYWPTVYGAEGYAEGATNPMPPEGGAIQAETAAPPLSLSPWPPPQLNDTEEKPVPDTAESPQAGRYPRKFAGMPTIPDSYAAPVISENFAGYENGAWLRWGSGYIKNDTRHDDEAVLTILEQEWATRFDNVAEPQVLIVHTHATESYELYDREIYDTRNTWRSTDNANNMVAVGDAMTAVLAQNGIGVLHDTTQHDYPSYNGSYERSAQTIQEYLEEYPSIKVVLDLHRDAIQREDAIVKPVVDIGGAKAAQIMIIAACDDGTMDIPNWRENLRFAALFQDYMEQYFPQLTKPAFFCYRKYNMDLTPGSLLLEFGSNANTLEEAVYAAQLAGQALNALIWDWQDWG